MLKAAGKMSKWSLQFSIPLERWSSELGITCLIGDAAHVVPSFLAQGAAMAIEDAATLTTLLKDNQTVADIRTATRNFEEVRLARKLEIQNLSLHNLHLYHLKDGKEQQKRDSLAAQSEELHPFRGNPETQTRVYDFAIEV